MRAPVRVERLDGIPTALRVDVGVVYGWADRYVTWVRTRAGYGLAVHDTRGPGYYRPFSVRAGIRRQYRIGPYAVEVLRPGR